MPIKVGKNKLPNATTHPRIPLYIIVKQMLKTVKAIYSHGAFIPQNPCYLPENIEVDLMVEVTPIYAHNVVNSETRQANVNSLFCRLRETNFNQRTQRLRLIE